MDATKSKVASSPLPASAPDRSRSCQWRKAIQNVAFGISSLLVFCGGAFGNVGVFSGSGHTLQLVKSADIRMVSEDVTITPVCGPVVMATSIEFRCVFGLTNLSPKPVKIQVGFPLDREFHSDKIDDTELVLSSHFIARDESHTYHVRHVANDSKSPFGHMFLWDMEFAGKETKKLHVGYLLPISFAAGTTRKSLDPKRALDPPKYEKPWHPRVDLCAVVFFSYITETGQSWAGPIQQATFRVNTNVFEHCIRQFPEYVGGNPADLPANVEIPDQDPYADNGPPTAGPVFVLGLKLGTFYSRISPDGWKSTYIPELAPGKAKPPNDPDGIVWRFENYRPSAPLRFTYYLVGIPETVADCDPWVRRVLGKTPRKGDLLELREIAAAFYGVPPQAATAKRFAEQQIWYNPQSKSTEPELSEPRRAVLARLKAMAEDRK
jgi:hypothetical protein